MRGPLPLGAEDIDLKWHIEEGGIGLTACTDQKGLPYIGVYLLNRLGNSMGAPLSLQHDRLMIRVVAGYVRRHPIVVFIDAEITAKGLEARYEPPDFVVARGYERHKFAAWGSEAPCYRLTVHPANSNWPVYPVLREFAHDFIDLGAMETK